MRACLLEHFPDAQRSASVKEGGFKLLKSKFLERVQAQAWNEVSLSVPEVRRLLSAFLWSWTLSVIHTLNWFNWRRVYQAIAKFWHYKRRLTAKTQNLQL